MGVSPRSIVAFEQARIPHTSYLGAPCHIVPLVKLLLRAENAVLRGALVRLMGQYE